MSKPKIASVRKSSRVPKTSRLALHRALEESVGKEAFRILYKSLADGIPPDDAVGQRLWGSDLVSRMLSDADTRKVALLALQIEEMAKRVVDQVYEPLRQNTRRRIKIRTGPFVGLVHADPSRSTKSILRELEKDGQIVDLGDSLKVVSTGATMKKTTIASKLSRLRKKLSQK